MQLPLRSLHLKVSTKHNNAKKYIIAVIVIIAFLIRLGYATSLPNELVFDEPTYNDIVTNLLTGQGYTFSSNAYYTALPYQATSLQEPMYPLFLTAIYFTSGLESFKVARAIQAILNTGFIILLMLTASKIWDQRTGIVAGLIGSVYIPFIYFTGLLMTENLFVFFLILFLYVWTQAVQHNKRSLFFAAGIIFGLICLTRGMTFYFFPVLLITTVVVLHRRFPRALYTTLYLFAGVVLIIAPWTWRNYTIHQAFVPISTKGGYNLYIYTYPAESLDFNNRFDQIPFPDMSGLSEVERDATMQRLALKNISSYPLLQVKFAIHKLIDFWNPIAERGPWYAQVIYELEFFVVTLLAVVGLVRIFTVKEQPLVVALLILLILFHIAAAALFTGGGKARMTIEPILVLLASSGTLFMFQKVAVLMKASPKV